VYGILHDKYYLYILNICIFPGRATCPRKIDENTKIALGVNCSTFPLLVTDAHIIMGDRNTISSSLAYKTLPCFLHFHKSTIPNAQLGVFPNVTIPAGYLFGPYEVFVFQTSLKYKKYAYYNHFQGYPGENTKRRTRIVRSDLYLECKLIISRKYTKT